MKIHKKFCISTFKKQKKKMWMLFFATFFYHLLGFFTCFLFVYVIILSFEMFD